MVELIALGLLIALVTWALHREKKFGRTELKKDIAENEAKILKKQRDSNVTNVDDALSVLKQVRKRRK